MSFGKPTLAAGDDLLKAEQFVDHEAKFHVR